MKKVVIFGAAGHTGKYLTRKMQSVNDIELSVFVRNLQKLEGTDLRGIHGVMLNQLAKKMPEYITAADTIAASSAVTTLLRCPGIRDGEGETYSLTREGEKPRCWTVDRAAIAQCMADMIADETLGANESLGITN